MQGFLNIETGVTDTDLQQSRRSILVSMQAGPGIGKGA